MIVEWNSDAGQCHARLRQLGLFVARQKDINIVAQGGQRLRQCAHYIGQATGLGIRNTLRRCKRNAHESSLQRIAANPALGFAEEFSLNGK